MLRADKGFRGSAKFNSRAACLQPSGVLKDFIKEVIEKEKLDVRARLLKIPTSEYDRLKDLARLRAKSLNDLSYTRALKIELDIWSFKAD